MIAVRRQHRARRIGLTPMIDVVFLLLIFFMLAARFGADGALEVTLASGGDVAWSGPPRLVDVGPDELHLNGTPVALADLADALRPLMPDNEATVVLRPRDDADVARLVAVIEALTASDINGVAVVE